MHTAGNSSGIVDGAAAVLIGSKRFAQKRRDSSHGRVHAFTSIGSEPVIMLTGATRVTEKLLKRAGMKIGTSTCLRLMPHSHRWCCALYAALTCLTRK